MSKQFAPAFGAAVPIRRSATLPTKLMAERRSLGEGSSSQQESEPVFFFHPSAKIVKFAPDAPPATSQSTPSADFDYPVDTIETLPWRSPAERTVAVGRLRLEMVSGLSPFLKCGTVVQAILKNSQCWCVDGKSTFVLRIRSLTYYRIELPNGTTEEEELIAQFKSALAKVLRYEVTPCPFQRGFSVPLPAEAHLPKKKRAWRPKHRRESAPAISESDTTRLSTINRVDTSQQPRVAEASDGETTDDSASTTTNSVSQPEPALSDNAQENGPGDTVTDRRNSDTRSVTEPTSTVSDILARFQPIPESDSEDDADSFHSLLPSDTRDPPSPIKMSPTYTSPLASPPDNQLQDLPIPRHRTNKHNRDISTATITPESIAPAIQVASAVERLDVTLEVRKEAEISKDPVGNLVPSESEISNAPTTSATGTDTLPSDLGVSEAPQDPVELSAPSESEFSNVPAVAASGTEKLSTSLGETEALQDNASSSVPSEAQFSDAPIPSVTGTETLSSGQDPVISATFESEFSDALTASATGTETLGAKTSRDTVDSSASPEPEFSDAPTISVNGTANLSSDQDGKEDLQEHVEPLVPSEPQFSDAPTASATGTETLSPSLDRKDDSTLKLRRGQASRKRDLSPLPPASTLEYPKPQPLTTDITTTIFRKTCSLVLVPPLQLLLLLIHIASRIVAGHTQQAASVLDATQHKPDTQEEDDSDYQMPKTPGTFRRSLLRADPSDSLSDLE